MKLTPLLLCLVLPVPAVPESDRDALWLLKVHQQAHEAAPARPDGLRVANRDRVRPITIIDGSTDLLCRNRPVHQIVAHLHGVHEVRRVASSPVGEDEIIIKLPTHVQSPRTGSGKCLRIDHGGITIDCELQKVDHAIKFEVRQGRGLGADSQPVKNSP